MQRLVKNISYACAIVLLAGNVSPLSAKEKDVSNLSLTARAGLEYDDNITVEQSDQISEQSDAAVIFEVEGAYKFKERLPFSPEISYAFYQSLYDDYTQYNMQSHSLALSGDKD
ncbi:MAG: hypothetical protein OEY01_08645 [Desulfobulbaceae bacterium]|nr:hypothetical protein [Desulfobulbaceae bacterium]HIJ79072.1 hypothetical protein [Deltaproteobacteria bacterium]